MRFKYGIEEDRSMAFALIVFLNFSLFFTYRSLRDITSIN